MTGVVLPLTQSITDEYPNSFPSLSLAAPRSSVPARAPGADTRQAAAHTTMSFDGDRLVSPSVANPACCSDECYRQCSPESCPGLTAQCTDRCVVVTCLDPHQEACDDIICDDQSCSDPTDCHGIYEFVSLSLPYPFFFPSFSNTPSRLSFAPLGLNPPDAFEWLSLVPFKTILPGRRSLLLPPLVIPL